MQLCSIDELLHSYHSDLFLKSFYLELLEVSSADDLSHRTLKDSQPLLRKRLEIFTISAYLSLIASPITMMSHPAIAAFLIAYQTSLFEEQLQLNIRCHSFPFLLRQF